MALHNFNEFINECHEGILHSLPLTNGHYKFRICWHPHNRVRIYVQNEPLFGDKISLHDIKASIDGLRYEAFSNYITEEELVYVFGMSMEDLMYLRMTCVVKLRTIRDWIRQLENE